MTASQHRTKVAAWTVRFRAWRRQEAPSTCGGRRRARCRWSSPRRIAAAEYPSDLLAASRLDPLTLRRSEDSFVDELFGAGPELGAPLLAARFPRAYLDVNREAWELDPAMFSDVLPTFVNARSPRVRMGLGTIARVVASGEEIYARKLRFAEAKQRVEMPCTTPTIRHCAGLSRRPRRCSAAIS